MIILSCQQTTDLLHIIHYINYQPKKEVIQRIFVYMHILCRPSLCTLTSIIKNRCRFVYQKYILEQYIPDTQFDIPRIKHIVQILPDITLK